MVEFGVDTITMLVPENIFTDIEHDRLVPSVKKKPNDNLQVLNSCLGFLLRFEVADEIKELMMRTFGQKIGKEVEIWLPLSLGNLTEAAANLFAMLRQLDAEADRIAVAHIPNEGLGEAISDRLARAAHRDD